MKREIVLFISLTTSIFGFAQVDTISDNIYQSNGNLGIETINPATQLHVTNSTFNSLIRVESPVRQAGIQLISNQNYKPFLNFGADGIPGSLGTIYYDVNYNQIVLRAQTTFNESKEMVLGDNGFVGIGTKTPNAKVEVSDGDIYINTSYKGIIMKSPDGTCWKGTVDNYGQLTFSTIECPELEVDISKQFESDNNISVYPNPTKSKLTIKLTKNKKKKLHYKIHNINGQILDTGKVLQDNQTIDVSSLSMGTYLLEIIDRNGNKLYVHRFVKE